SPGADWALNLMADPQLDASWAGTTRRFRAEPLDGDDFASAITGLILRYGTPSEGLGNGPAFRLRPVQAGAQDTVATPNGAAT
ncbi:MAG: hypothetical protein ABIZ34_07560, partial [Candidatus Limnocylindrales bacterium]